MDSLSDRKLNVFSICSPKSNPLSLINRNYPIRVKPLNLVSVQTNTNLDDGSHSSATKDTDSETKEHREDSDPATPPQKRSNSIANISQPNSARDVPKSILRPPRIGISNKKGGSYADLQSFVDTNLTQEDSCGASIIKQENGNVGSVATPRRIILKVSHHKTMSSIPSSAKPQQVKKVTFSGKIVDGEKIQLVNSDRKSRRPHSFSKVATIKPGSIRISVNQPPVKCINNFFNFSSEEIAKNFDKEKKFIKERNIVLVSSIRPDLVQKGGEPELNAVNPLIPSAITPVINLVSKPNKAAFNLRLPLVLSSNTPKSDRLPVSSDRGSCTPQVIKRQVPLSSRESTRKVEC